MKPAEWLYLQIKFSCHFNFRLKSALFPRNDFIPVAL